MAAGVSAEPFGRSADGREVERWTLTAGRARMRVLTLGGIVQTFEVPDRDGALASVVLGFPTAADYDGDGRFAGSLVGRIANRIAGGRFTLDGRTYQVPANDGPNALHGGPEGFWCRPWAIAAVDAEAADGAEAAAIELRRTSPDGEMGFPGTLDVAVRYRLADDGDAVTWSVDYTATTDAPTVVALTSHAYFTLGGEGSGDTYAQRLRIPAERVTAVGPGLLPTGELAPVAGTPLDFREPCAVGERLRVPHPQLLLGIGYDHNYVLDGDPGPDGLRLAAELADPVSGRRLVIRTTEPGLQFHSGNFLTGSLVGIGGGTYRQGDGICLETQHFPDAPNQPAFPSVVLRPGETYRSRTEHVFTAG
jgi:aldose 1-epimerase